MEAGAGEGNYVWVTAPWVWNGRESRDRGDQGLVFA